MWLVFPGWNEATLKQKWFSYSNYIVGESPSSRRMFDEYQRHTIAVSLPRQRGRKEPLCSALEKIVYLVVVVVLVLVTILLLFTEAKSMMQTKLVASEASKCIRNQELVSSNAVNTTTVHCCLRSQNCQQMSGTTETELRMCIMQISRYDSMSTCTLMHLIDERTSFLMAEH